MVDARTSFILESHVDNEMYLSRALERLGGNALSKDSEPDIGAAFLKFAVVTKELSALMKTLNMKSYKSIKSLINPQSQCNQKPSQQQAEIILLREPAADVSQTSRCEEGAVRLEYSPQTE
uniref:Uncharacterized protein n=1 Tax=Heliothis virescens TaxID=7102 RepID=A0A2A4JF13_HELVI